MAQKTSSAFKVVRNAIRSYEIEADEWKQDHHAALHCYELEDFLLVGIGLFNAINEFDELHRARVLSGELEYDPGHSGLIRQAYRWWLEPCDSILAKVASFRSQFGEVKHSDEFLACCREAKGILTADADFFSGDSLASLRDEALDENDRGETFECR